MNGTRFAGERLKGRKAQRVPLNQKGTALLTVYIVAAAITGLTGAAVGVSFAEMRHVQREVDRIRSFAAAEAGIQSALAQIGQNGYTGFINVNPIEVASFQDINGNDVGAFDATLAYPDEADWVIVTATGAVESDARSLEARVFLESNFSKYLVYADTADFGSGTNAQYGDSDGESPQGVPANEDDRAALYFTGQWTVSGSNVHVYGDVHTEDDISGNSSSYVHGDTYIADFVQSSTGVVTDDGITNSLNIGDGFEDDLDRNNDGQYNAADYLDQHDLTATGADDSHATEDLVEISHSFYSENNSTPQFNGSSAQDRFIQLVDNGSTTQLVEYNNAGFGTVIGTHSIPSSAIVYVKGDLYVKGEVEGRVTFVSSDDIVFSEDVTYAGGSHYADPTHSTAFFAKDRLYFYDNNHENSGILYAENSSGSSVAFDATYRYNSATQSVVSDPNSKASLNLYGNRIINGSTNLSYYDSRVYGYDQNLRYYRPPGIPVFPDLRTVRETSNPGGGGEI